MRVGGGGQDPRTHGQAMRGSTTWQSGAIRDLGVPFLAGRGSRDGHSALVGLRRRAASPCHRCGLRLIRTGIGSADRGAVEFGHLGHRCAVLAALARPG